MGGRGGGSPAATRGKSAPGTVDDQSNREVFVAITDKIPGRPWTISGDGPAWLLGNAGLVVSREGGAFVIRNSVTDEVMGRGSTLAKASEDMALKTRTRVTLIDETRASKVLGRFGTGR